MFIAADIDTCVLAFRFNDKDVFAVAGEKTSRRSPAEPALLALLSVIGANVLPLLAALN